MLLHGQATCCDQLHQNEQEKQVHLEDINLLAMAENIFLALKGIKPVVFIFFYFFFFSISGKYFTLDSDAVHHNVLHP